MHAGYHFNSDCEKVSLNDNNNEKKFKIININQATNVSSDRMDGDGNKFDHKTQLIEIDKLIIYDGAAATQRKSSKNGVWHQVSLLFGLPTLLKKKKNERNYSSTFAATAVTL